MNFVLPPKSQVGVFNPESIGEGQSMKVLSDGEAEQWIPPVLQSSFPDWSKIPKLAKYFGRTGGPVYPAWLFHPAESDRLVQNAEEAGALGVVYRKASDEEKYQFGKDAVWDWEKGDKDLKWRPFPQQRRKFDPHHMETGKVYVVPNSSSQPNIESLVAAVTASVLTAMKSSAPATPGQIDNKQWEEFLAFQAFQKTSETVNALVIEEDRESWIAEAERLGIKVDKRWSTERLKSEVQSKAA